MPGRALTPTLASLYAAASVKWAPSPVKPRRKARPGTELSYSGGWLNLRPALGWELRGSGFRDLPRPVRLGVAGAAACGQRAFAALLEALEGGEGPRFVELRERLEIGLLRSDDLFGVGRALGERLTGAGEAEEALTARALLTGGMDAVPVPSSTGADVLGRLAPGELFVSWVPGKRPTDPESLVLGFREPHGPLGLFEPDVEGAAVHRVHHRRFADLLGDRRARLALGVKFRARLG